MSNTQKRSFDAVKNSAKNGPRHATTWVCFSDEISEQYQALEQRASAALEAAATPKKTSDKPDTRRRLIGSEPPSDELFKQMGDLIEANPDAFYEIHLKSLPRTEWRALRAQHAPRTDNAEDANFYNSDTFPPAALEVSMVDPEPSEDNLAYFEANLTNGDWERLALRIWSLNESGRPVPKAVVESLSQSGSASS